MYSRKTCPKVSAGRVAMTARTPPRIATRTAAEENNVRFWVTSTAAAKPAVSKAQSQVRPPQRRVSPIAKSTMSEAPPVSASHSGGLMGPMRDVAAAAVAASQAANHSATAVLRRAAGTNPRRGCFGMNLVVAAEMVGRRTARRPPPEEAAVRRRGRRLRGAGLRGPGLRGPGLRGPGLRGAGLGIAMLVWPTTPVGGGAPLGGGLPVGGGAPHGGGLPVGGEYAGRGE
jgi:hypothetical protein